MNACSRFGPAPAIPEGCIIRGKLALRGFVLYHHHLVHSCANGALIPTFTISSYSTTQSGVFCENRGFMLRPPIAIPRHKDCFHPLRLSSFLVSSCSRGHSRTLCSCDCYTALKPNHPTWLLESLTFVAMSMTSSTATGAFVRDRITRTS